MQRPVASVLLLLSSLSLVLGATKTTTAKWTQTKATVIVKFPLTRGSGKKFAKCTDETVRVEGEPLRFVFSTVCGPDTHTLDVPLFSGVTGEPEMTVNSRRTEAVVTLTKSKVKEVWKHLTATPEKYKALISRAPAPYEKLEIPKINPAVVKAQQETQQASVGPGGRVREFDPEQQRREKLIDTARDQAKEKRVTSSTLDKLRAFVAKNPDDSEALFALANALRLDTPYKELGLKERREVLRILMRAVELPPPPGESLGRAYYEIGMLIATGPDRDERWEETFEYMYAAVETEPSNVEFQKAKKAVGEIAVQKRTERELAEAEQREAEEKEAQAFLEAAEDEEFEREEKEEIHKAEPKAAEEDEE